MKQKIPLQPHLVKVDPNFVLPLSAHSRLGVNHQNQDLVQELLNLKGSLDRGTVQQKGSGEGNRMPRVK